jgi:adenylate kinase
MAEKPMVVVFLGPPGSGKGTQADNLREEHGFTHFDTGSRLREEIARGSELGREIASYTDRGQLVPITIIRSLVFQFLRETDATRILFDGFPRNLEQAEVLDEGLGEAELELNHAIYLEIDEDNLLDRIVNRRFCPECGEIYNLKSNPPKVEGRCDHDGAELIQRKDDTPEVFANRLKVYTAETVPVLDFYRRQGRLRLVDGDHDIEDVNQAVLKVLGI